MIKAYEKFRLIDQNKKNEVFLEVNWDPKDEQSNECKLIKMTFPNGDVSLIKKEHLNAMLFALGNREEQMMMIPQKLTKTKWYETVVSVKATKDIQKGEEITFPIKLSLPATEEEIISDIKNKNMK